MHKSQLQFPLFNFAPPAILKQWIDSVMTYGFAYGSHSQGMKNRNVGVVVSAGIKKGDYSPNGRYHFEMSEILAPLELAFKYYFKASYRGFYAIYGKEEMPGVDYEVGLSQNDLEGYLKFIRSFN